METAIRIERPDSLGRLTITVTPPGRIDTYTAKRHEGVGVDRLVLIRDFNDLHAKAGKTMDDVIAGFLEDQAKALHIG